MKRILTIEGIEYVVRRIKWGKSMEIADASLSEKPMKELSSEDVSNFARKSVIKTVLESLVSWTFRGCDEEGDPKTEGDVLPINEDSLSQLPSGHGVALEKYVDKINTLEASERKN